MARLRRGRPPGATHPGEQPGIGRTAPAGGHATQLTAANAANSTSQNLARLIGSPLGGLAVGLGGIEAVVIIDAASFIAVAVAASLVRSDTAPIIADADTRVVVEAGVRAGLRTIRRRRVLFAVILINGLAQVAQGLFLVLFVVFVVDRLDGDGVDVGVIRASMAVGAIVGAAAISRYAERFDPIWLVVTGFVGIGASSLAFWNAPAITTAVWVYLVLFGLSGLPGSALGIGIFTTFQRLSPPGMLGRVAGIAGALSALARATGSLMAGLLVDRADLLALLNTQAAIYMICGLFTFTVARYPRARGRTASLGASERAG